MIPQAVCRYGIDTFVKGNSPWRDGVRSGAEDIFPLIEGGTR
jgi:hypothetical protein